jgi:hypothetical protein
MRDTLQAYYDGRPSPAFARPAGVVEETVCVPSGLKPTPLCGKTTKDLFVKESLPTKEDDWWQRVRVDLRTGQLAGPLTPPQLTEDKVALVLPPELLKTDEDKKRAQEWAEALGLPLAPSETSNVPGGAGSDLPAIIYSPTAGTRVFGVVTVLGRAFSPSMEYYRLEYGSGAAPTAWIPLMQAPIPVQTGPLGIWNTTGLPPGPYTLRVTVQDRLRGQITASTTVTLSDTPPTTPTPTPSTGAPPLRP